MRLIFILISCIAFCYTGFSQAYIISDIGSLSDQFNFEKSRANVLNGPNYSNIEGSPYLSEEFIPGEVILNDSIRFEKIPLRYNIYSDKIEFRNDRKQILEIDASNQAYRFNFGNLCFTSSDYSYNGHNERGILELLADGKIRLYKKYLIDFKPATKAIGFKDAEPDKFVRLDDDYLIATGQGNPEPFRNTKELLGKLKQIKPDIEQYAKDQKLKLKSEKGLIQLIQFCNN